MLTNPTFLHTPFILVLCGAVMSHVGLSAVKLIMMKLKNLLHDKKLVLSYVYALAEKIVYCPL